MSASPAIEEAPSAEATRLPRASGLYRGVVSHRRFTPKVHRFRVRLFFLYLDLDELPELFRDRWLWSIERRNLSSFRREDFFGDPAIPLDRAVRARVSEELGRAVDGPVRVLTHLRTLGVSFNPVRFYYVFAADGETPEAVLAEITNTPWNERHSYVTDLRPRDADLGTQNSEAAPVGDTSLRHHRFDKAFHVSPFFGMDHQYDWGFSIPGKSLEVWMQNFREGRKVFEARLELERAPITGGSLARALIRYPWLPAAGLAMIYWQAFRLWWKRTPFFPHPSKSPPSSGAAIESDRGVLP